MGPGFSAILCGWVYQHPPPPSPRPVAQQHPRQGSILSLCCLHTKWRGGAYVADARQKGFPGPTRVDPTAGACTRARPRLLLTWHRGDGGVRHHPPRPPGAPPTPPPQIFGQIFLWAFGQSKIVSGAFGANRVRPKIFFRAFGASQTQQHRRAEVCGQQKQSNDPANNQHNPQYANYWAPLTHQRHIPPHPAQPRHTNDWAPRTRKRHQQEHRPQRPTERSDPTQHAKGRAGDCPGPP